MSDITTNIAVRHFTGNDEGKYDSWYDADTLEYLTHTLEPNPDVFRYIFTLDGDAEQSYYKQFVVLSHLTRELEKCVCFVGVESPISQNHFIFGIIINNEMLLVNPTGITQHKNFAECLKVVKHCGKLNRIYQSTIVLQMEKDTGGLFSCGPICIELMRHISQLPIDVLLKAFTAWQTAGEDQVDITKLLPQSLTGLLQLPIMDYRSEIIKLRANHLELLHGIQTGVSISEQDAKLESCLHCSEQRLMFDIRMPNIKSEAYEDFLFAIPRELGDRYQDLWNKQAFINAIASGDIEKLNKLLQNSPKLLNSLTLKGFTALMLAMQFKKEGVIKLLLSKNVRQDAGSNTVFTDAKHFAGVNAQEFVGLLMGSSVKGKEKMITEAQASRMIDPEDEEKIGTPPASGTVPVTLGDGNCAFNAFALGLCDLALAGKLDERLPVILRDELLLKDDSLLTFQTWLRSNPDFQCRQQKLQGILRKIAVDFILKNYETIYESIYKEQLSAAYSHQDKDDTFIVHSHIGKKFAEKPIEEELLRWWDAEGKEQYFANIKQSAKNASEREKWGGEPEIDALATGFGINIIWRKGQAESTVGICGGIIKDLTPDNISLLNNLGLGKPHGNWFFINTFINQDELTKAMDPVDETLKTPLLRFIIDANELLLDL